MSFICFLMDVLEVFYRWYIYWFINYVRLDFVIIGVVFIKIFNGWCICGVFDMFGFESWGMLMYMK